MSTADAASLSCLVSWISAALGAGSPDGWLCGHYDPQIDFTPELPVRDSVGGRQPEWLGSGSRF